MDIIDYINMCDKEDAAAYHAARNADRTAGKRPAPGTEPNPIHGPKPNEDDRRIPFNVSHDLKWGCPICPEKDDISRATPNPNLSRCSACRVVYYCSPEHQAADRPTHKKFCKRIQKATFVLEKEEAALKAHKAKKGSPNPFNTKTDDVWQNEVARKYMLSGKEVVLEMIRINTKTALEKALDIIDALTKMSYKDPMGLRCITPFLLIRLGQDQECYSLCEWWVIEGNHSNYDWRNPVVMQNHMKEDSNVFDSVKRFTKVRDYRYKVHRYNPPSVSDLSHLVAVTLVKIRARWGLLATRNCKVVTFQDHVCTNLVWNNPKIKIRELEDCIPLINELEVHITELYLAVDGMNPHFWPALLNPGDHLTAVPNQVYWGSEGEMQKTLQECYNAWAETEGAIGLIRELSDIAIDEDRKVAALSPEEYEAERARALGSERSKRSMPEPW
ncbi:hypothetical protein J4E80_010785 [Alternaria sp. BMP 0032]|nr:hypothetical protein J4E80_010785 [Alternaria sp. BMP 0032]